MVHKARPYLSVFRLIITVAKVQQLLICLLKVLVELRVLLFEYLKVCLVPLCLHLQICRHIHLTGSHLEVGCFQQQALQLPCLSSCSSSVPASVLFSDCRARFLAILQEVLVICSGEAQAGTAGETTALSSVARTSTGAKSARPELFRPSPTQKALQDLGYA